MRSVDQILAHLHKFKISKPTLYEVHIFGKNGGMDAPDYVSKNCCQVAVPGVNISYTQDKRHGVGVIQNFPTQKLFQEINMSFYESENQYERKFFSEWVNEIINPFTKRLGFFKEYSKTIVIRQFDRENFTVHEVIMYDCFPTNISPQEKAYGMNDSLPMFSVGISFNEMEEKFYEFTDQ